MRAGSASEHAPSTTPKSSVASRRRGTPAVVLCALTGHPRVLRGEHSVGVVTPDPEVQSEHTELVLALEGHAEEIGRRGRAPCRVRDHQLNAHQTQLAIRTGLIQQSFGL